MSVSADPLRAAGRRLRSSDGFTILELLVSMVIGLVVTGVAFSLLNFTLSDVNRVSERATVDQAGIRVMERLMLQLHSACVAPEVTPIRSESTATTLRFISQTGTTASLEKVELHEVVYTPPSGAFKGSLVEKSWESSGTSPNYTFNEAVTPTELKLLKGVKQTESIPVFRYYRYYTSKDASPVLGTLYPTPLPLTSGKLSEAEAKTVTAVNLAFTVTPELREPNTFSQDRPVPLEDSTIFRLSPASESASITNGPCASS